MSRYFLTRLKIEGFRGINNENSPLDIKFRSDQVNSIFAANGLGKSSIYDALTYAIRGCLPKLDRLPATERGDQYYTNRFHSGREASITLHLKPDDGAPEIEIRVTRSATGDRSVDSPSGHADPQSILDAIDNAFVLLDHPTFLEFVQDSPLNRGRSFASLLGLSDISSMRQTLEVLSNARNIESDFGIESLTTTKGLLESRCQTEVSNIRRLYKDVLGSELIGPPDAAAISKLVMESLVKIELVRDHFGRTNLAEVNFDAIRKTIRDTEASDLREALLDLSRNLTTISSFNPAADEATQREQIAQLIRERDEALQLTRGPLFKNLYSNVQAILELPDWQDKLQCPACDTQPITDFEKLTQDRVSAFEDVDTKESAIRQHWNEGSWVSRWRDLETCSVLGIREDEKEFSEFRTLFESGMPTVNDLQRATADLDELDSTRLKKMAALEAEREKLEKVLPPSLVALTGQIEAAERLGEALESHRTANSKLKEANVQLVQRERWKAFIEYAAICFKNAEVDLSSAKTTAIESEYKTIYAEITKNPEIVPILMKSSGSEELHLRLEKFFGLSDLSAATLLPESYRNAFAISIYLSASIRSADSAQFMILDDVTSSFDAGHQFELMELLRRRIALPVNPDGVQLIVLSHDGLLEKYFDRLGSDSTVSWHHQRLLGNPPSGNVMVHAQHANRLRTNADQFLSAGQVDEAKPLVRQYLEFKLEEIIRTVGIRVPIDFAIRDHKRLVSTSLSSVEEQVGLYSDAGHLILSAQQATDVQSTHVPAILGNWLSHYATASGSSLSPYVVRGVLDAIDHLADCFKYDCTCSGATQRKYYKSLREKRCGC